MGKPEPHLHIGNSSKGFVSTGAPRAKLALESYRLSTWTRVPLIPSAGSPERLILQACIALVHPSLIQSFEDFQNLLVWM